MDEKRDYVMVTVSGPDRPGITAAFTKILAENQVQIVDIEQASLQDFLGLSFLLDMSGAKQSKDSVLKDLLFEASQLNLALNFRLFSEKEVKARNSKNLFVLTYFGDTRALAEISNILGEESANIEMISNLTQHCASHAARQVEHDLVGELGQRLALADVLDVDGALEHAVRHQVGDGEPQVLDAEIVVEHRVAQHIGEIEHIAECPFDQGKLDVGENVTVPEVVNAIENQSVITPSGQIGGPPAPPGTDFTYTVRSKGRLLNEDEFNNIIIRTNPDGSQLFLKDIARIQLGSLIYSAEGRNNGKPSSLIALYQTPGSNAIEVAENVKKSLEEMPQNFPPGLKHEIVLDTTLPIEEGISEIVHTLFVWVVERAVLIIIISRCMERVGDHATNICEAAIFVVKGVDIKHHGA